MSAYDNLRCGREDPLFNATFLVAPLIIDGASVIHLKDVTEACPLSRNQLVQMLESEATPTDRMRPIGKRGGTHLFYTFFVWCLPEIIILFTKTTPLGGVFHIKVSC